MMTLVILAFNDFSGFTRLSTKIFISDDSKFSAPDFIRFPLSLDAKDHNL